MAPDVRPLPRSLANIFTEYSADLGYPQPSNGDLTPWSQRGVMLLNRCSQSARVPRPRTEARVGGGHRMRDPGAGSQDEPMVAILWGRDAATLKPMLTEGGCATIESTHPPLSASRGFGSRPFSRSNELLNGMGADPLDWRLP